MNITTAKLGKVISAIAIASLLVLACTGTALALSTDANLSALTPSAGTLDPVFDSGTTSYTASVPYATASMTVTPTAADAGATITVNGNPVTSGSPSGAISLSVGANVITTEVTAEDTVTIKTYTLTVTRAAASTNADLSALTPSAGTLDPVFDSGTTSYTASVPYATASMTVTPTKADAGATITVNGNSVTSGSPSGSISLSVGANVITTEVTAEDAVTIKTYTLTVTRAAASTNADLSNLAPSAGTLAPAFASGTISYTASVPGATTGITVTPTAANAGATITVNGVSVTSGSPSGTISLSVGANVITTVVTAENAVTTKTYTLTVTRPRTTTYSGANGAYNTDTWNTAARWNNGIPNDTTATPWDVQIANSVTAGVALTTTPVYTGSLTLGTSSQLVIGEGSTITGLRAMGTGPITFNTGSTLTLRWSTASTHSQNIVMAGDAFFGIGSSTAAHDDDRTLTGVISGIGKMSVRSTNGQRLTIQNTNPLWSGGLIMGGALSENKNESLRANAAGAFGTGNVTIDDGVGLVISVANAITDTATLSLSGGDGEQSFKLTMDASDTVNRLLVDGYPQPAGTYGSLASAATYKRAWITGAALLTVSTAPTDTPTAVTFAGTGAGGSTTSVYNSEPVTYTIVFNEPHSPALTTADLENSTGTAVTIGSVTPLPLTGGMTTVSYRVVITPTAAGTLNLRIKSGTVINDLFGNALVVPAADNDTLTVSALPAIQCPLGVWKPWANNRINPATGVAWAVGDTYRLAFKTTTTRNATSTNIAEYNSFVQSAAAASTTFPSLGTGTWKVIGSTATVSAKVNTGTSTGTGVAVILMDGSTLFATNNADLWNGTASRPDVSGIFLAPYFNQNGVDDGIDDQIYTGTNIDGTSHVSQPFGAAPVNTGKARPNTNGRWMVQFNSGNASLLKFFALSDPLTLLSTSVPEIAIEQPPGTDIPNNNVVPKNFGNVTLGSNASLQFTLKNTGTGPLNLTGTPPNYVLVGGTNSADFSVTTQPLTPVAGPGSTTFTVQFAPGAVGVRNATLTIANNDADEPSFVINVRGTGQTAYDAWATGNESFSGDANGDGVKDGIAFLLGAANPSENAISRLPTVTESGGNLILTFNCLPVAARGGSSLKVAYGSTLASWTATTNVVPDATGADAGGVVSYVVDTVSQAPLNKITVTIDSAAAGSGKLFGQLQTTN